MATHAAFLRGVNLGSHRRVSNTELQRMFTGLGLSDVKPFRTSGNVAFTAEGEPVDRLTSRIEDALAQELGYDVVTFVRTAAELRAICAFEPFERRRVEAGTGKLQVSILAARPSRSVREHVLAMADERDLLAFGERELYWLPSGGTLETALDLAVIDRALGPTTRRTKGTLDQLAAKHFAV
jgi:uncharacterized protein (DUF1697 family)